MAKNLNVFKTQWAWALAAAILLPSMLLLWVGNQAIDQLTSRTATLLDQSAEQSIELLMERLRIDMRGAFVDGLVSSLHHADPGLTKSEERQTLFDAALRKFTYPAAFFEWRRADNTPAEVHFYVRPDRPSNLFGHRGVSGGRGSQLLHDPALSAAIMAVVREHVPTKMGFAFAERTIAGHRYQIAVRMFLDVRHDQLNALVGFLVDLDWVREAYFTDLVNAVGLRSHGSFAFAVRDGAGRSVATFGRPQAGAASRSREFPLLFYDLDHLPVSSPIRPAIERWSASVALADTDSASAAFHIIRGGHLATFGAAGVILVAVIFTVRAMQMQAALVALKSAFVARVTHELKTPLTLIRVIVETLELQRTALSPRKVDEYYGMLTRESTKLERLIDQVLTFGRDEGRPTPVYRFERTALEGLVGSCLDRFRRRLEQREFALHIDLPQTLPFVRAHPESLGEVFDNLVENAIKYASDGKHLAVCGRRVNGYVEVAIADRGKGIPRDELGHIFDPFFRGRATPAGGNGLGLAIVRQVLREHGGYVRAHSGEGGTTFTVGLPIARGAGDA